MFIPLILWIFVIKDNQILSESNEELCDIRKWYLQHTALGTFDGDISPEKLRIKTGIEDIMLRGQSDPTLRFVRCEALQKFDEDLKGAVEKVQDVKSADKVSNEFVGNIAVQATVDDQSLQGETNDDSEVDETDMDDTEMMEDEETEEENNEEEMMGSEDVSESLTPSNAETGDIDRVLEEIIDENQQSNDDILQRNDSNSQSDHVVQEVIKNEDEQVKESEMLKDKESVHQVNLTDNTQSDHDGTNLSVEGSVDHVSDKLSKTVTTKKRKSKFGICRLRYSQKIDIFDIQNSMNGTEVLQRNTSNSLTQGNVYSICSGQMVMSPNYCLMQHVLNFSNDTSMLDNNDTVDSSDNLSVSVKDDNPKFVSEEMSGDIKEDDRDTEETKSDQTKDGVNTKKTSSKEKIVEYLDHNLSNDKGSNVDAKKEETINEKHPYIDLENLEMMIASKTREYETKMQSLELVIMKLENQILIEKLNKQNHPSTMSRLETQILRLENELLKMNQSYHDLRYDNEVLKRRQRRYLELGHSSVNSTQQDGEQHAVITEQQAKISHLSQLLQNQTNAISEMKTRSDYLEEQNRMLYQMVMNQTALMSQIMMRVQELSEQNIKQREEAQKLKEHLKTEVKTIIEERQDQKLKELSTRMLRDIDNIVSDKKLDRSSNGGLSENEKVIGVSSDRKICTHEFQRKWCFGDSICVYNTIVNSWCVPYSSVFWTECGAIYFRNRSMENEFGPFAKDAVTGEINKRGATEASPSDLPDVIVVSDNNNGRKDVNQHLVNLEILKNDDERLNRETDPKIQDISLSDEKINDEGNDNGKNKIEPEPMVAVNDSTKYVEKQAEKLNDNLKESATSDENPSMRPLVPDDDTSLAAELHTQAPSKGDNNAGIPSFDEDFIMKLQQQEDVHEMDQKIEVNKDDIPKPGQAEIQKFKPDEKYGNQQHETIQDQNQQNGPDLDRKQNDEKLEILEQQQLTDGIQKQFHEQQDNDKKVNVSNKKQDSDSKDKPIMNDAPIQKDVTKPSGMTEQKPIKTTKTDKEGDKVKEKNKKATKPKSIKKGTHAVKRLSPKYAGSSTQADPKDCYDLYLQGRKRNQVYRIKPYGLNKMIEVFCDMKNGGWTIILKRQDGTTNFFREWSDYKKGFGGVYGEHWIGNDYLHRLTNQDEYMLRVDLMDWKRQTRHALYDYFLVEDEEEGYRLHVDGYSGDAGDAMNKHNGHKFSTKDMDNDKVVKEFGGSCAKRFKGAGWYYKCYQNNLNGKYYRNGDIPEKLHDGITWKPWTGPNYSLKQAEMKIRPRSAISNTQS